MSSNGVAYCESIALIGHNTVLSTACPRNRNFPQTCWMNFLPFLLRSGAVDGGVAYWFLCHRWLGHLDIAGVAFFVIFSWIAWKLLWHSLAWMGGLVFYCSPNQAWCQCIVVHPILLSQFNFPQWCSWGVLHVPHPRIWLQNRPWRVWTVLVSNRGSKNRGKIDLLVASLVESLLQKLIG